MSQSPQEMFKRVAGKLSQDAKFSDICQQADNLYPADRFESVTDDTSPIEQCIVSLLGGGWLMPFWYRWYHSITQAEIDRYLVRALLLFRDKKDAPLTTFRPGEQALIGLLGGSVYSPIVHFLNAMNPIGILLRRVCSIYGRISRETADWFWQVSKQPSTSNAIVPMPNQRQEEIPWWQVFKKRAIKQAWDDYWSGQEHASFQKSDVEEQKMKNTENELTWTGTQFIAIDNEQYEIGQWINQINHATQAAISQLEKLVNEDDRDVFWEQVTLAHQSWEKCCENHQKTVISLRGMSQPDNAMQEGLDNLQVLFKRAKERWEAVNRKIEQKLRQNPWSPESIEAQWETTKEAARSYQSDKPDGWFLSEGVEAVKREYEELMSAFKRIKVLLRGNSASSILDEMDEWGKAVNACYRLRSFQILLKASQAEKEFYALAQEVVRKMKGEYDAMLNCKRVDISVYLEKSNKLIADFIKKTREINPACLQKLDERRKWLEGMLKSFQEKYCRHLEERLVEIDAQRTALVTVPAPEPTPRSQISSAEASDEISLEHRKYYFMAEHAYQVLGIELGAPKNKLESAYRKQSLNFHPDKNTDCADEFMKLKWALLHLTTNDKEALYVDNRNIPHEFYIKDALETEEFKREGCIYIKNAIAEISAKHKERARAIKIMDAEIMALEEESRIQHEQLDSLQEGSKINGEHQQKNDEKLKNIGNRMDILFEKLALYEAQQATGAEPLVLQTSNVAEESRDTTPSSDSLSVGSPPITFAYKAETLQIPVSENEARFVPE